MQDGRKHITSWAARYGMGIGVVSQFEIAPTDCPPRIGGQRDRVADPARGGSYSQGKLFDLTTTPALRATPPVPGGEPEFQTETTPTNWIVRGHFLTAARNLLRFRAGLLRLPTSRRSSA